jgi:outer membrane lipoprotein carrier protein
MRFLQKLMLLTSFIFYSCVHAQTASDDLTNLLLNIHTMQADFVQTIRDQQSGKTVQQSRGHIMLERPGKFRWDVTSPIAQLIIANGTRLWIYDKDLEQVTIRLFRKATGQTPALLLSDKNLTLGKDFNVSVINNPSQIAGIEKFLLTPKDKEDTFETITLTFMNKQIHEMQLKDHLDHLTVIAFQRVQMNKPLAGSLFTFQPPANVDVIDETKNRKQ